MDKTLPARTELHAIPTLTLTDQQFLVGDSGGVPTTITGMLSLAQGATPQPAVVLMHGSGGIGPGVALWVRQLNAMGVAAFVLDGFTGRGLVSVSTDQARLGRLAFVLDIYRALALLARHPAIDPARIVVMGFSRGGQGAVYAGMTRFRAMWNADGPRPAATIALYPDCGTRYIDDTDLLPTSLRIFHGVPDDFNPIAPVRAHVARLREAGHDVALTEYADAHHGFDNPLGSATLIAGAQSVRDCRIEERAPGLLVNAATGLPFTYADACVATSAHVGGHAVAGAEVRRDVAGFLNGLFTPTMGTPS
ncbi:dienelactone hydrolase family protein [Humitalea sp. 24SJ18S-53]|uniref:dienelactone hydrolase family protein n=1 Tax=Humitalea sp. 24SJ18S-53 TaxID=3422307 RepID=UPI003D673423